MKIRLSGIVEESYVDGSGIRTAVFVQGCPHKCEGCHNEGTHDFSGGYDADTEEIAAKIAQNPLIMGITFSGGEPFCQAGPLAELAKRVGKNLWVYTGYTLEELLAENDPAKIALLALTDVLVDGKFILSQRDLTLKFRGSKNQRLLDSKASLKSGKAIEIE